MSKQENDNKKIIIEGTTPSGKPFRPSNWAERMSGKLSTIKNHRLRYSPLLTPITRENGHRCVAIDPKLKHTNPELFADIIQFAKTHNLPICGDTSSTASPDDSEDLP